MYAKFIYLKTLFIVLIMIVDNGYRFHSVADERVLVFSRMGGNCFILYMINYHDRS